MRNLDGYPQSSKTVIELFSEFDEPLFCTFSADIVFDLSYDEPFFVSSRMRRFPWEVYVGIQLFSVSARVQGTIACEGWSYEVNYIYDSCLVLRDS